MDKTLIEKLTELEASLKELEQDLSKVDISKDPQGYAEMAKRHSDLTQVVDLFNQWKTLNSDITDAQELLTEETDQNTKKEYELIISDSKAQVEVLTSKIKLALLPKDPSDEKDVLVEIRPGAGGEEASIWVGDLYKMYNRYAERNSWKVEKIELIDSDMGGYSKILFASDLLNMYQRYADLNSWKFDVLSISETGLKGVKEAICNISGLNVFSKLKFESGVHRVQRVPTTESSGRVHTSAATVAVLPEAEEVDLNIDQNDLKVDVYRSSGPGGQSVNTTDSAVRITHIPTGLVVSCQDEKSQLKNKNQAMRILRARLLKAKQDEAAAERAKDRKEQVGSGERSDKIRTYNYKDNRVSDHRINLTVKKLDQVLDGDLDDFVDALVADHETTRLANLEE